MFAAGVALALAVPSLPPARAFPEKKVAAAVGLWLWRTASRRAVLSLEASDPSSFASRKPSAFHHGGGEQQVEMLRPACSLTVPPCHLALTVARAEPSPGRWPPATLSAGSRTSLPLVVLVHRAVVLVRAVIDR